MAQKSREEGEIDSESREREISLRSTKRRNKHVVKKKELENEAGRLSAKGLADLQLTRRRSSTDGSKELLADIF